MLGALEDMGWDDSESEFTDADSAALDDEAFAGLGGDFAAGGVAGAAPEPEGGAAKAALPALGTDERAARARKAGVPVRHPELKLKIPAWVFCMSWCPDFEFRGT